MVEDGATFEENALKKARTLAEFSGLLTLADDSGLEVDALEWQRRASIRRATLAKRRDDQEQSKTARELQARSGGKARRAVCLRAGALCAPKFIGHERMDRARILRRTHRFCSQGANGFGYDPLFFYPPLGKTFGEIDRETKATVSHRGKALQEIGRRCLP